MRAEMEDSPSRTWIDAKPQPIVEMNGYETHEIPGVDVRHEMLS
jgi:hypothetical protein